MSATTETLSFQQKIAIGKKAVTDAGFMVHPRFSPKGDGVQVYALIPIPVMDFSLTPAMQALHVRDHIGGRCQVSGTDRAKAEEVQVFGELEKVVDAMPVTPPPSQEQIDADELALMSIVKGKH